MGWEKEERVFRRRTFLQGRPIRGSEIKDITWFDPSGDEMTDEDWTAGFVRAFSVRLAGDAIPEQNSRGEPIIGDSLLLLFNSHHEPATFTIPLRPGQKDWELILDTTAVAAGQRRFGRGSQLVAQSRSMVILGHPPAIA